MLGCNQQRVQAVAGHPYVFAGVVGPVPLPAPALRTLQRALDVLVPAFGVRGLGSLDALLAGETIQLLEINARPPHSLALYPRVAGRPVLDWHWRACAGGELPPDAPPAATAATGQAVAYAHRALTIDAALAARIAAWPQAHDLPQPGTALNAGDPVCSVGADGPDAATVHTKLDAAVAQLLRALDTHLESPSP
jgi:predicted ATP-grasp superfamily ATP-dependent carboligase